MSKTLNRGDCLMAFGMADTDTYDAEALRKAYKYQRVFWHPDKHPTDKELAVAKFNELERMYEYLLDLNKQRDMDKGHSTPPTTPRPANAPQFDFDIPTLRKNPSLSRLPKPKLDEPSPNGFLKNLSLDPSFLNDL